MSGHLTALKIAMCRKQRADWEFRAIGGFWAIQSIWIFWKHR